MNGEDQSVRPKLLLEKSVAASSWSASSHIISTRPNASDRLQTRGSSATLNRHSNPRGPLHRTSMIPEYRDWPQSPLHAQRDQTVREITEVKGWSLDDGGRSDKRNYAQAYEFRRSDGQQHCDKCEFGMEPHRSGMSLTGNAEPETFEAHIKQWLAETRQPEAIMIRMFIIGTVRKAQIHGLAITRQAFKAIEQDFQLHPATLNLLHGKDDLDNQDVVFSDDDNLWLVNHFESVVDGEGWRLSLRYDLKSQRTDAVLFAAKGEVSGPIVERVIDDISSLHNSWGQFQVLPQALLQHYTRKWLERVVDTRRNILLIEKELGASRAWEEMPKNWPQEVGVQETTASLHGQLTFLSYAGTGLRKIKRVQQALTEMESRVSNLQRALPAGKSNEYSIWTDTLIRQLEFKVLESGERARIQADLLFSIINQQDSHDNIALAQSAWVFTFITALFLPCTVVASIFSMDMFNWRLGEESDSDASYISGDFWIYWAVSVPLTMLVMGAWYWWSVKGWEMWARSARKDKKSDDRSESVSESKGMRARSRWVRFLT